MKVIAILLVLVFSMALVVAPKKSPLEGTWKFVSSKDISSDKTVTNDGSKSDTIKIFTPTHVTYFSMSADKKQFVAGGVARLEMKGNRYTETIEYTSLLENLGKMNQYEYRIEGDKLYQSGVAWNGSKGESVWQRVK